jgi:N6-L-threonylcarbamoyladenine synthase
MKILAIETSCDETAVCVLDCRGSFSNPHFKILSNIVASQVKIHAKWGGVVPNLAKREHQRNLPIILKKALKESKLLKFPISNFQFSKFIPKIDIIAVTNGPGLEPALWVGINFSQELAKKWKKPLIGINHLEGHAFSVFLKNRKEFSISNFPARNATHSVAGGQFPILALIVSGGHTELVLIKNWLQYKLLGETLDDAAGEAFDKVARLLGLGYPGGPAISKEAAKLNSLRSDLGGKKVGPWRGFHLPRPMINSKDYNFSFSGLKTAVLYKIRELGTLTPKLKVEMAHEFQQAVIDCLLKKTMRAAKEYRAKTIILGGGVAANKELRKQMAEAVKLLGNNRILLMPEMEFTGDNAAMIALPAYFRFFKNKKSRLGGTLKADGNLRLN